MSTGGFDSVDPGHGPTASMWRCGWVDVLAPCIARAVTAALRVEAMPWEPDWDCGCATTNAMAATGVWNDYKKYIRRAAELFEAAGDAL